MSQTVDGIFSMPPGSLYLPNAVNKPRKRARSRGGTTQKGLLTMMEKLYFEVQGIGRVSLVQECGANLIVEDESGTRLSLPASRCTVPSQTAAALADSFPGRAASIAACDSALAEIDALADQFTGEDLGAAMAAAESAVRCADCRFCLPSSDADGHASEEVGVCEAFDQFRAMRIDRQCGEFKPLLVEPLRVDGYRVGDAHQGGEG